MEIRKRLTYQFIAIVALILFLSSLAIYISFSKSRKEEFYDRLANKARLVAQMLIDIDEINADLLKKIEKNNPLSLPNEKIVIFDYLNNQIYSSDETNVLKIPENYIDKVRIEEKIRYIQKPYEILGEFYTSEFDRIVVFAAATDIFGINKLKRLRLILFVVFISGLFIIYFAGHVFAARALNPVTNIILQVNSIGITNLDQRIDEGNGTDELARLAKTFNGMLHRLESAFKIQKNFIANASHELRTPLTAISGQIEVLLMKDRKTGEYQETLISVLDDMRNLNHLANKLLLLAQASSETTEITFTNLRIDDTLWNSRSEIIKRKPEYSITISFSENITDEGNFTIYGNELLLKTVIINLIDNACKYSPDKSATIFVDTNNKKLVIHFIDKGIGIPTDDVKMIFQPFYRAKNAMGERGHGLGLSLVDKIISQHGGKIELTTEVNSGSDFMIYLPLPSKF
ncbi:MAG TPA: two-component sensor histidine kinase [Bacteroidales bacterium]|nr:two-component sensor histidine kinase [Bacteroidales bacterium]